VSDTYFGRTYKDPYRWLEDLKNKEVEGWFKAQADLTDITLAKIRARDALADEWMKLDRLETGRYTSIAYKHGRAFYKKKLGSEKVGKLYTREGLKRRKKLLFSPPRFKPRAAKEGDVTTIVSLTPSPDGRLVALGFSAAGAEFSEIRILDVDRRELLPESMYPSYGPLGWTMDSKALFYDIGKVSDIKSPEIELN